MACSLRQNYKTAQPIGLKTFLFPNLLSVSPFTMDLNSTKSKADIVEIGFLEKRQDTTDAERRLNELGYKSEFRRDMSLFGVLGISFCAIRILTGMSSAFQTGLFSGGPLGLFWGWNVSVC